MSQSTVGLFQTGIASSADRGWTEKTIFGRSSGHTFHYFRDSSSGLNVATNQNVMDGANATALIRLATHCAVAGVRLSFISKYFFVT